MATSGPTEEHIEALKKFTACDIADALLKLKVPNAGFIPDLKLVASGVKDPSAGILIAPASTVIFASKEGTGWELVGKSETDEYPEANIPAGKHWVDLTEPGTVVVMTQPEGQKCAVLGGIMALRVKMLEAKGIVVCGRVRDVEELEGTGLPIWSKGTSIVGAGAESKPHAIQVPLNIDGTIVKPGDLVFSDPANGVVIIPKRQVLDVLSLLPYLVEADNRVKEDVALGMTVQEAFKKHRG